MSDLSGYPSKCLIMEWNAMRALGRHEIYPQRGDPAYGESLRPGNLSYQDMGNCQLLKIYIRADRSMLGMS